MDMYLNTLIQNAVDQGACEDVIKDLDTYDSFEDAAKDKNAPFWCYWYACVVIKERWIEGERIILKSLPYSYYYAIDVIKGRWKEAEQNIFSDEYYKSLYCTYFNIKE